MTDDCGAAAGRTGAVGSANSGAVVEWQNLEFFTYAGPQWARIELRRVTQILRAGNIAASIRESAPVNGVRGKANMGTECPF